LEAGLAVVIWSVEGEGVEPDAVAGATETVFLLRTQGASVHAVFAAPFEARVEGRPGLGDATDFEQALEEGEGLGGGGGGDVGCLGGVVGCDADCVGERAVLLGEGEVEGGEAVVGEDAVEVFAGCAEGVEGADCGGGLEDVEEDFVG